VRPDPRAVLSRPAPAPDLTTAYGQLPDQVIDVRLPTTSVSGQLPLVVVVHGGFWRAEYDRAHIGPLAAALAAEGWPVAVIEYRRTGQPGGGWPGTFDDVRAAVRAAPAVVDRALAAAGRPALPPGAILLGHSAGGHLALWYAVGDLDSWGPTGLRGVLALAPVADLADAHALNLDGGAVAALLGGSPAEVPRRYAATDPCGLPPPTVPAIVLHGTLDNHVPPTLSRRYAGAAAASGGRVDYKELDGTEHFGLIDPQSAAWSSVTTALRSLT